MNPEQAVVSTQKTKQTKDSDRIGFGKMLLWQSRSVSLAANILITGFLTIYCTDTLGVPAALVGILLMASKIVDAVTDLFAGYLVDKTNTRLGKGRPYELCIIGMWLCTWLMFSASPQWTLFAKAAWILSMYIFVNAIFATFLNASETVYMVRAFTGQQQYVKLSSYGGIITMLAAVLINVSFPILMASIATSAAGWSRLIALYAVPLSFIGLLRFLFVKETRKVDGEETHIIQFSDVVTMLKTNPYIYIIALMTLVLNLVSNMGVGQYYYTHIVKNIAIMGPMALTQIVLLPIALSFPPLIKKFSTTKVITGGIFIAIGGFIVNYFAYNNLVLLVIGGLLTGLGAVPISMLTGLLIIDCAEYNEWKGIPRFEGTLASVNGFAAKLGAAVGAAILGVLLTLSGYTGAGTPPESSLTMIRMLFSVVPLVFYALIGIVLRFYKLDEKMPQIRKENMEAREAEKKPPKQ